MNGSRETVHGNIADSDYQPLYTTQTHRGPTFILHSKLLLSSGCVKSFSAI
jgi:hypothetical protein